MYDQVVGPDKECFLLSHQKNYLLCLFMLYELELPFPSLIPHVIPESEEFDVELAQNVVTGFRGNNYNFRKIDDFPIPHHLLFEVFIFVDLWFTFRRCFG